MGTQSFHRHCNREICFSGSRRTDSENYRGIFYFIGILLLSDRFRLYRLAFERDCNRISVELLKLLVFSASDHRYRIIHALLRDIRSARNSVEIRYHSVCLPDRFAFTFNKNPVGGHTAGICRAVEYSYSERFFDLRGIAVKRAEYPACDFGVFN